ncbi:MAG: COX15/CtaA family protein [Hyphomicrobiaceae bacterium]|nr:COX15/CtaA family protein [Hyphomicrobiaceae bacterium]
MAQQRALSPSLGLAASGDNAVRVWLFTVAALIFLMVGLGGATRLTGSGLSITEWQPIMGAVPPLSDAAWQEAFEKYQQIPQYEHVNRGMSLAAFKLIYWWEWTHRFLGRLIGAVFLVPFLYFLSVGQIGRRLIGKLAAIFVLGALQGFIGWYMVSSGLAERISVSQYRLALHMTLAVAIFGATLWVALSLGREPLPRKSARPLGQQAAAAAIAALVLLQIAAGAFVAGLKAGAGWNTWPLMEGQLIPQGLGAMTPWWANLFENALTVQFSHRLLAYAIAAGVAWHLWPPLRGFPDKATRASGLALGAAVLAQIVLGISTLLAHVPIPLALLHQAGAVAVFGVALWHWHRLSYT